MRVWKEGTLEPSLVGQRNRGLYSWCLKNMSSKNSGEKVSKEGETGHKDGLLWSDSRMLELSRGEE